MSASNTDHAVGKQTVPYPSFQWLGGFRGFGEVDTSPNAGPRIFWSLSGPLTTAISIMKDAHDPESLEPYFDKVHGTWHPVSQLPLTEPKVSSITVEVEHLSYWETAWKDFHWDHSVPGGIPDLGYSGFRYGPLKDYDPDSLSDKEEHLLACCGEPRPRKMKKKIVVTPAESGDKGFVTVHNCISTVLPWLMSLKETIVRVMNAVEDQYGEGGADIMVSYDSPERLMMLERTSWIEQAKWIRRIIQGPLHRYGVTETRPEFGPVNETYHKPAWKNDLRNLTSKIDSA